MVLICVALLATANGASSVLERRALLQQRAASGPAAIPVLTEALNDDSGIVRRTAVRLLVEMGEPAKPALIKALDNSDLVVRIAALRALCSLEKHNPLPYLAKAIKDKQALLRQTAAEELVALGPRSKGVIELLQQAQKDKSDAVRKIATDALWNFHREVVLIRHRLDWDHDVKIAKTIRLPKGGWRFKLDPKREGHLKKWFDPALDDSDWATISIEQAWQKAGYDYIGVAWYRRWITMPPKPKHVAVEIRFKGVDESAWVWLNGKYVGDHDIGPNGWNQPFLLDITNEIKWGQKNLIAVRAMNTAAAGGIWRPVQIEVLQ